MRVPGCSRLGSAELTCSWMRSLLGPSVKLVEKSTAHFSSVTDSVPFRSQRLIFFRSCQGEEVGGMRGKGVVGFLHLAILPKESHTGRETPPVPQGFSPGS